MDKNRVRWASRRGMLELDLILGPFVEENYDALSADQQRLFHALLECEDQDLFGWFMKRVDPQQSELLQIVQIIRDSRNTPGARH
ncbi:succinate dehydrogenase assembly factor 2 family protein [Gammaproteobacteria bacterium LSUCC0057]|uniref:FAD assembly factor SdhE n=1 Tax=Gammaproteobacteria bacterium LSUCC0057 TaxID=2559237 RepID=A0A4Y8UJW4_9GAMM|nr:succinate dehydrogenase assembly factor 2 family protein [Gammaproteobacteria bacterium LSUCC0057]